MAEKTASDPLSEFSGDPSLFGSFVERNQKAIAAVVAIAVLGGAGWGIAHLIRETKNEGAAAELAAAKTPEALQEVATKRADTPSGPTAALLLAEGQWKKDQKDQAIETLRSMISSAGTHPSVPVARATLGSMLMQQAKYDEAKTLFNQVSADPKAKYLAPYALMSLGDLAKIQGDVDAAKGFYAKAKSNEFGPNSYGQMVEEHEKLLKFKQPAEIDPPAPPAAPPEVTPGVLAPGIPSDPGTLPTPDSNPLLKDFGKDPIPAEPANPAPAEPAPGAPPAQPGPPPAPAEPGK